MATFKHLPTGKRFLFIHIPRTAGRYIGENLGRNDCQCEQGEGKDLWVRKNNVELSHYHREYYEKYLDVEDIPHFAVVRNPIDRFISCAGHVGVEEVDKKVLNYLTKGYGTSQYFYHFRSQVEFISPKTHIWKYEDGMGKEFVSWLSGTLDIDFVFDDDIEYYRIDNEHAHRIRKTPYLIDIVREFYKEDFERFYPDQ